MASEREENGRREEGERHCNVFLEKLASLINQDNVTTILTEQENMLQTLEVANEKLSSLNGLSEKSFTLHAPEIRTYTQTLGTMKRELDSVFRRIRFLKAQLSTQYPEAYSKAQANSLRRELEAEDEQEKR